VAKTPHNSPWRTFIIGRQPADLIQSDLVLNLATPSKLADTSWIKTGHVVLGHLWPNQGKNDLPTLKQFIQLAADMGWPYQLSEIGDKSIVPELVAYGKERGVRIWLWYHFNDFIDRAVYQRDFPPVCAMGHCGTEDRLHDRDDQWVVNWYEDIARTAAENHLLIDFHGAFKPTGLERTWPNQLTREGVQAMNTTSGVPRKRPNTGRRCLFTRFLAGPGDYTPADSPTGSRRSSAVERGPPSAGHACQRAGDVHPHRSPFMVCLAIRPPTTRTRKAIISPGWIFSKGCRPCGTKPTAWPGRWENTWSKCDATVRTGTWPPSPTARPANCRCR